MIGIVAAFFAACALPSALLGQSGGTIVGTVVDDLTGEILAGASLSVRSAEARALSDTRGFFELTPVAAGDVAVRVEHPGYVTLVEQIEVVHSEMSLFQFRMTRTDAALQTLLMRARAKEDAGATVSRIQEDRASVGQIQTALDLLREQVPGVTVPGRSGSGPGIRIRGSSSLSSNDPALYVDGLLLADGQGGGALDVLDQIPAASVLRIRVLHGPAATAQYGDASSGVILVETR